MTSPVACIGGQRHNGVRVKLSLYYVLSVPYVAGLAAFGGPDLGGFRLTGWVFAIMLAAAPVIFIFDPRPIRSPIQFWIPWTLIVVVSLAWSSDIDLKAVQDVCQIITPFVIAPVASLAVSNPAELRALLRSFQHCLVILLVALTVNLAFGVTVVARPMAMTAAMVGCVFLAQIRERRLYAILGWSGCLLVSASTGSRMATFVILLEWLILPGYRRFPTRVLAAGAMAILAAALFYTPLYQHRFFLEDQGTLGDVAEGDFFDSGRFEAWEALWPHVADHPFLGSGANSSAHIVRSVWENVSHPHNDYLRILLDQGAVGLSFFLFGVVGQIASLWSRSRYRRGEFAGVRSAASMGILVMLVLATTDNPIVYGVWFMHPLFVLVGTSYSRAAATRGRTNRLRQE